MFYNPERFIREFQTDLGQKLWLFLNTEEIVIRLKTASDLKRPAAESIETSLIDKFKDHAQYNDLSNNRYKQMIGNMIRQVLEAKGYKHDKYGVKIRNGKLFSTASRYKEK
ncbi:MAG: hypothetical protein OEZ36_00155 [Spirochaetota bacterium]|nr:hypothetical protein [Spirochaetota bacterium]